MNRKRSTSFTCLHFFLHFSLHANDEFQCQLSLPLSMYSFDTLCLSYGRSFQVLPTHQVIHFCFFFFFFCFATANCTKEEKSVSNRFNNNNKDTESHIAPSTCVAPVNVFWFACCHWAGICNVAHPNDVRRVCGCVCEHKAYQTLSSVINGKMNVICMKYAYFSIFFCKTYHYVLTANRLDFTPH